MTKLIVDVLIASLLYIIPGYFILSWFDFRDLKGLNRLVVALSSSLIFVPYSFILVANLVPFKPGLMPWLILIILIAAVSFAIRRWSKPKLVEMGTGSDAFTEPKRLEKYTVFIFLLVFAAFTNLPRILMFMNGGQALDLGPASDESWHLEQLVSVARTGIPPTHYLYPSLRLVYYYASWIYPAILGNLPGYFSVSLLRAMAIHVFIQVFTFLGLLYVLLQFNIRRTWVRLVGLSFVTVMGGFDLYAKMPNIDYVDWWQRIAGWLNTSIQISQFPTLYEYVPQHLAGGMVLLLLLLLYKNTKFTLEIKIACTGLFLGFCFMTSPFLFAAISLAIGIGLLAERRWLHTNRSKLPLWLGILALPFLVEIWYSLGAFIGHGSRFTWNDYYVPVVELLRGNSVLAPVDKILNLLGLPLVGGAILTIEMGLAFLMYVLWWGSRILSNNRLFKTTDEVLLGIFPLLSLLLIFLFRDQGGGDNFAMRGFIPAQIFIVLTSVYFLNELAPSLERIGWRRWVLVYIYICFLIGQSFSTYAEVRSVSVKIVKLAIWKNCGWGSLLINPPVSYEEYCWPTGPFRYVYWLNRYTPNDALVLESGPFPDAYYLNFHWLERNRLLVPQTANWDNFYMDQDFILPAEWNQLLNTGPKTTKVLDWYNNLNFRYKGSKPVYLVSRDEEQVPDSAGAPVYVDEFVKIYRLEDNMLHPSAELSLH